MSRFKGALLGAVVTAAALPGAAKAATITVHDTASSHRTRSRSTRRPASSTTCA